MAGSNGQVTGVNKSASSPPVWTVNAKFPAGNPPPPPETEETYIIDAADAAVLSPHVGCACKFTASGTNNGPIGSYSVKK